MRKVTAGVVFLVVILIASMSLAYPVADSFRFPLDNYNPNLIIGVDPTLGDILFKDNEYPIIRGGWVDRNGISYEENLSNAGPGPINIFIKGFTKRENLI